MAGSVPAPAERLSVTPWVIGALAVLAGATALLVIADEAEATHLRGGSIYWEVAGQDANGVQVRIKLIHYWGFSQSFPNWGSYSCPTATCTVGDVLTTGTATGTINVPPFPAVRFDARIIAHDPTDGWFGIEAIPDGGAPGVRAGVVVNYPTPLNGGTPWVASYTPACCRTDNPSFAGGINWYHINNPGDNERLETFIYADGLNRAPVVAMPPFVNCLFPAVCDFLVPAVDPDEHVLAYSLATGTEMGGGLVQPSPPLATNALTIGPANGIVVWNTAGATTGPWPPGNPPRYTIYSTQDRVTDGIQNTKSSVDYFVRLMPTLPAPTWTAPTICPPHLQMTQLMVLAGDNVNFTLWASTPVSGNIVKIGVSSLPHPWARITYGPQAASSWARFDWNTTGNDIGIYIMTFYAYDNVGAGALLCPIVIRVVSALPDFTCVPAPWPDAFKVWLYPNLYDPNNRVVDQWWRINGGPEIRPTPSYIHWPAGGWFNLTYSVRDQWGNVMSKTHPCWARPNLPPAIQPVNDITVMETRTGIVQANAVDPDGDPTDFFATGLPPWGRVGLQTGTFEFRPPIGTAGQSFLIDTWARETQTTPPRDLVTAPLLESAHELFRVTVEPLPDPGDTYNDGDVDGPDNYGDNCFAWNPSQTDSDNDGIGDACEELGAGGGTPAPLGAPTERAGRGNADGGVSGGVGNDGPQGDPGRERFDQDADGIIDAQDNCPATANSDQADMDRDGLGDLCDADMDGDGVPQLDRLGRPLDTCPRDPTCGGLPTGNGAQNGAPSGDSSPGMPAQPVVVDGDSDDATAAGRPAAGAAADDADGLLGVSWLAWGLAGAVALVAASLTVGVILGKRHA